MASALEHPQVVDDCLHQELPLNRMVVFPEAMSHTFTVKPGKWRLIVNLSSQVCRGALMAKVDIKQAYHMVPVHPDDHCLLAMR